MRWVTLIALVLLAPGVAASDEEIQELITDLGSAEAYTRAQAAEALTKRGAAVVPALAAIVKDVDSPLRLEAVLVLERMGPVAAPAAPALAQAVRNPNEQLRLACARTLQNIGPPARIAINELIDLGDSRYWIFRFAARDALAAIGPEVAQVLIESLVDGDEILEEWAPSVFFALGAKTVPAALKALQSDVPEMRAAGADALAAAGPAGIFGMQALIGALYDKTALVRRRAALALGRIGRGAADASTPLIALANDAERRATPQAMHALGAILRDAGEAARKKPIPRTELKKAIALGLAWLAAHQDADGKWDADQFFKHDPKDDLTDGPGGVLYDTGITGLAVLAFLESGTVEQWARPIRRGLRYLVSVQDNQGNFGPTKSMGYMYSHAAATLAMCEASRFARDPTFRNAAQRGLDYIARSRNPDTAWRYKPRSGKSDTSVTGWMVMCLKAGQVAGFRVDPEAFAGAMHWVRSMTDDKTGFTGYNVKGGQSARPTKKTKAFPPQNTRAMTAEGVLVRLGAGERPGDSPVLVKSVEQCLSILPRWNLEQGFLDMYYWFQGTRALYHYGDAPWRKWSRAASKVIPKHQHPKRSGSRTGSWDPIGAWGEDGGRVYSTAMMILCLETLCGYTRPFELKPPSNPRYKAALLTLKHARRNADPALRKAAEAALAGFEIR